MINIVKYGGSIINSESGYNKKAIDNLINNLNQFPDDKFIIIIGGGKLARKIQYVTKDVIAEFASADIVSVAQDWFGLSVSRINAEYVKQLVSSRVELVHNEILIDPNVTELPSDSRIFFSGGWKPGFSTDYVSMLFAKNLNQNKLFKISDFEVILDVTPQEIDKNNLSQYAPLPKLTWNKLQELIGTTWTPGLNAPLDVASVQLGLDLNKSVNFKLSVGKFSELHKMLKNEKFNGSVVE